MSERAQDRIFTATGITFVVLELVGFGLGGPTHQLTVTSTTAKLAETLGKPAGTPSWVGAYLDLLSVGAFLAFAIWTCSKLGGGLGGQIGRAAATSYATVTISSLALMDTIGYRAGHALSVSVARNLVTANEALFVGTWFLSAFFLLAVGALALGSARRTIGWSAIAVALFTLATTAISINNLGQFSILLFMGWTVGASITLGRTQQTPASALVAQRA